MSDNKSVVIPQRCISASVNVRERQLSKVVAHSAQQHLLESLVQENANKSSSADTLQPNRTHVDHECLIAITISLFLFYAGTINLIASNQLVLKKRRADHGQVEWQLTKFKPTGWHIEIGPHCWQEIDLTLVIMRL